MKNFMFCLVVAAVWLVFVELWGLIFSTLGVTTGVLLFVMFWLCLVSTK